MGKPKKGKRSGKDDDLDSDIDIEEQSIASQDSKTKSSKSTGKDKKKKKDDIDDLADDLEELKVDKSKSKKGKKSNRKAHDDSDDESISLSNKNVAKNKGKKDEDSDSEFEVKVSKGKKKSQVKKGFAALNDSDNDDEDDNDDDDEEKVAAKAKGKSKKKKGKKGHDFDDFEDDDDERVNIKIHDDDDDDDVSAVVKNKVNSKKNKKKKDDDFDNDSTKVKGKTKKGKKKSLSDDDDDDIVSKPGKNKQVKSVFALLDIEGDDDDDDNDDDNDDKRQESEDEEKVVSIERPKTKQQNQKNQNQESAHNKKGRKGKKKNDSDDEIEKVLAELEMEYSGKKGEKTDVKDEIKTEENKDNKEEGENKDKDEEKKKKDKKKNKAKAKDDKEKDQEKIATAEEVKDIADDDEKDNDESGTVKTAAQKKKEKKEREKAKKLAQKKGELPKKPQDQAKSETPEPESSQPAEATEELDDDSKKKKKLKEDPKAKGKGPSKVILAKMQDALKKLKEDEERAKREEEERIRQEELREQLRLKQLQEEQERKERKKLKEKQRKERLKAEGKLLTPKQKQDRARAQAMLDALKAQGLEVPDKGEKKPRTRLPPGARPRLNKLKQTSQDNKTDDKQEDKEKSQVKEDDKESNKNLNDQVQLEIIDSPAVKEDVGEIKDSWDVDSSEGDEDDKSDEVKEQKTDKVDNKSGKKVPGKKVESEESEDSSDSDEESDDDDSEDGSDASDNDDSIDEKMTDAEKKRERARIRIANRRVEAEKKKTLDNLRAAVVCVLGHVDTGKTKILDKLRRTNVQDSEAGGITQQIGATNVPIDAIIESTKHVKGIADKKFKIPGLLIIDTPGHESFSNLRNRGSSLCDIAILVVDIMHGLEPQTLESIGLLKAKKCPFVVALNKIDRLYDWQTMNRKDVQDIIKSQAQNTQMEFEKRADEVIGQFAEQGLNAALFYKNPDPRSYVSLVPTSAITGEGMGNLLSLIVDACQGPLAKRLMYSEELQATVLEVKALPGLGTTIDCILVNGALREGDTMIVAGTDGPIVTQIRSLLMPQPLKELRVKNAYIEYREIKAAQGVKIAAKDLEKAIAGLNLLVAQKPDEVELLREEIARELSKALGSIKLVERGVFVQASTLGALEALLDFLKASKIPYAGIRIGPVVKKDVMKASIMLEHDSQYATILAFDVKIERDAQELADSLGVKIFQADIIYHLFDKFTAYRDELKQRKRDEFKHIAVFPCKFRVLPQHIFNSRDPIVVGVMVEAGIIKEGTPVCVPSKEFVDLGVVTSIQYNHKDVESARKGQEVCVKIEPVPGEAPKMYGRHFDDKDMIVSKISRQSIDACKDYFRDDLLKTDWQLMVELKKLFQIL